VAIYLRHCRDAELLAIHEFFQGSGAFRPTGIANRLDLCLSPDRDNICLIALCLDNRAGEECEEATVIEALGPKSSATPDQ
jgi:hypothetical protein